MGAKTDSGWDENGISLDLISHDKLFKSLKLKPIIVNDFAATLSLGRTTEEINRLIRTHYTTDELDTLPSCDEGCTSGGYNLNEICETCGTKVIRVVDRKMESQVWMRAPDGVDAFINPRFWSFFTSDFKNKKFDLLEYLTNPTYIPGGRGDENSSNDERVITIINALEAAGIERGLNFFYRNFDMIMNEVLQPKPYLAHKSIRIRDKELLCRDWKEFITIYRGGIFSKHIPFPSKLVMVSETGGNTGYIDRNMPPAFDAVKTIASCVNSTLELSHRAVESRTIKAVKLMAEYYTGFRKKVCGKKPGMFRRQLGSTRSPYTGRAVIAPRALDHVYDELHTPWGWSITLLRVHIANKLLRADMTPYELHRFIDKCTANSEGVDGDFMEEILNELISEAPGGGIGVGMLRNPTLERLSNQPFRITKIIRNTNINAILMSVLTIKGPNADFDGDQLQVRLLLDAKERDQWSRLASHLGIMDTDNPRRVKSICTLHPEIITMTNNFLEKYRTVGV